LNDEDEMKPSEALATHRKQICEIVSAHHASNARVFGSVAAGTDTEISDLDILIDPMPEMTLFDIGAIRFKLKQLLGVSVDVLTPKALPAKFRQSVIEAALPI
jgi:predicted nucleotidyltransferase